MIQRAFLVLALATMACGSSVASPPAPTPEPATTPLNAAQAKKMTDAEWRERLTDMEYYILRDKGTERAFTGDYWNSKADGTYVCGGCGQELFESDTKFDSGTGWPSFWQPTTSKAVDLVSDHTLGMTRTEVVCSRCGGHLGHVFPDGPPPTGQRYCINGGALDLVSEGSQTQ